VTVAQTKRKRRRKHKGTPAGNVVSGGGKASPKGKSDGRADARQRRQERMDRVPTWRGAVNRAAIAAVIFGVLLASPLFSRPISQALVLTVFVFALYIPLGYGTDKLFYNFRQRRKARGG
jgi:uncharacterized membrane protein YphA (DoxX/SURF4 family)